MSTPMSLPVGAVVRLRMADPFLGLHAGAVGTVRAVVEQDDEGNGNGPQQRRYLVEFARPDGRPGPRGRFRHDELEVLSLPP